MSRLQQVRAVLALMADLASLVTAVTVVGIAVMMFGVALSRGVSSRPAAASAVQRPSRPPVSLVENLETGENETSAHPPGAAVALVEFSDFQCPFCARFMREVYPRLQAEFVETGRIVYVSRQFPLEAIHPFAVKAAEAVECAAEQGRFWDMREQLFSGPRDLGAATLLAHASSLGLDRVTFEACLQQGRTATIRADQTEGRRLGVSATPTFFVGVIQPDQTIHISHKIQGAQPYEVFRRILEEALATASESQQ